MTNFETSIYKHFSLFLESNICISSYLMSFSRYAFAHMVISLYEFVSNDTTTKNSWKWLFIFRLTITCFREEGRKLFPFVFVMTYTEIHFLPIFMLFPQSAQLNHFSHNSLALQRGKNILFFRKIPRNKSDNFRFFWDSNAL